MQPEHASLLAGYAERYLAEIPEIWQTRDGHMRVQLANVLFPYPAVSPDVLARIEEFVASPRDPGIVRIVTDHYDEAQRALRLRSLALTTGRPGERGALLVAC